MLYAHGETGMDESAWALTQNRICFLRPAMCRSQTLGLCWFSVQWVVHCRLNTFSFLFFLLCWLQSVVMKYNHSDLRMTVFICNWCNWDSGARSLIVGSKEGCEHPKKGIPVLCFCYWGFVRAHRMCMCTVSPAKYDFTYVRLYCFSQWLLWWWYWILLIMINNSSAKSFWFCRLFILL